MGILRLAAALVFASGGLGCGAARPGPPERIVLIVIDTLRRDHLSCYGGSVATPHIDALAARGRRFTTALASFHQTTMSMGALFTGRTPSVETGRDGRPLPWTGRTWCGMSRFASEEQETSPCLPASLATLGETIRDAGYETLGVTSNPLLFEPAGFARGFTDWAQVGTLQRGHPRMSREERHAMHGARAAGAVNEAVARVLDRRGSDRFFLYVHYMDVHDYPGSHSYAQGVARVDEAVGELLGLLRERALLDGAVVVLTSDHGERLRERHPVRGGASHNGNPSFEYLLRVPLIVAPPALGDPSRTVRSEDLYRLLAELAGAEPGPPAELEEGELYVSEMKFRTYRRGRWKSTWSRRDDTALLFDLERDPAEARDVSAQRPEVMAAHRERIEALSRSLAAGEGPVGGLSAEDRRRLRALGYLDDVESGSP